MTETFTETFLGKIRSARFGVGGYQDCCIGLSLSFDLADGSGVSSFKGFWGVDTSAVGAKWSEADRDTAYANVMRHLSGVLKKANVRDVTQLKGIPVEVTMVDFCIDSWRVLTEVL